MPALACCVDAAIPPGYAFPGESSLPTPESFSGVSPVPNTSIFEESSSLWTTDLSTSLYKINGWGFPYFSVNSFGNVTVRPHGVDTLSHQEIDLMKIIKKVSEPKSSGGLGLRLPLIIRLPDVLRNRLQSLQSAFDVAIISQCYNSHYQGVYPVKCNQERFIVEDIVEFGSPFRFGLEAGSKPELLLAMSCLCKGSDEAFLICNGYKDPEYVSLALMGRKLNLNIVIVLEQEEELDLVISTSQKLGIRPVIGLRAKLRTKHSGHFGSTSGEKGKFGLTTLQILRVAKKLQKASLLDCLQLLHFHIGSQIPSTSLLADGVSEAAQVYCELVRFGADMRVIDIGGGLGIDYDGTRSPNSEMSVGYGLNEYASTVVQAIRYACDSKFVRHPIICSESGRALVSHHSVLVFEATSSLPPQSPLTNLDVDLSQFVQGLTDESLANYRDLTAAAVSGDYDTSLFYVDMLKERCVNQFKEGLLDLEHLAAIDILCDLIHKATGSSEDVRTYHVNLSLFTSIPDFWAIGQMFPILPIHHLDKRPAMKGILSDLTCDSDGKIDKFIGGRTSLPLHEIEAIGGGGYYLGMFLGGAYQEALGGLHNLFGGPSVVRVTQCDSSQSFTVTRAVPGVSCADVLRAMQHEPKVMFETLKRRVEDEMPGMRAAQAAVADALATTFQSMPYLVSPTCSEKETYGFGVSSLNSLCDREDDDGEWAYCSS